MKRLNELFILRDQSVRAGDLGKHLSPACYTLDVLHESLSDDNTAAAAPHTVRHSEIQ